MSSVQEQGADVAELLKEILESVRELRTENANLASTVDQINGRVNVMASVQEVKTRKAIPSHRCSWLTVQQQL
jgi:hypothetical protein